MERTTFPPDLLDAQARWIAAYEAIADTRPAPVTALRRRLIRLSTQVYFHPYLTRQEADGRPELLLAARTARAHQEVTAA